MWEWLGEPLPLDVANSLRRRGTQYQDLWRTWDDVLEWARHEVTRLGPVPAEGGDRLDELRELRDDVFAVLLAVTEQRPYPVAAAGRIDARARAWPVVRQLGSDPVVIAPDGTDAVTGLLARVVHATVDLAGSAEVERLGFCDAPSCGQFFLRDRTNQQWCGPACGTRVRVARHTARR
jgi:predicted RNA-binding Zn ribbon-like protein